MTEQFSYLIDACVVRVFGPLILSDFVVVDVYRRKNRKNTSYKGFLDYKKIRFFASFSFLRVMNIFLLVFRNNKKRGHGNVGTIRKTLIRTKTKQKQ